MSEKYRSLFAEHPRARGGGEGGATGEREKDREREREREKEREREREREREHLDEAALIGDPARPRPRPEKRETDFAALV